MVHKDIKVDVFTTSKGVVVVDAYVTCSVFKGEPASLAICRRVARTNDETEILHQSEIAKRHLNGQIANGTVVV